MLIGETWLKENINFKIPNYNFYRTDRIQQPQGGTAVLIKKHIPHIYHKTRPCQIENTIIEISTEKGPLKLIAGYCSPNKDITQQDLDTLLIPNEKTILLADLNAKNKNWGCNTTNLSGRNLLSFFQNRNVELLIPTTPTHYHATGRPEILDIGIAQDVEEDLRLTVIQDLSSDHNPIAIEISIKNKPTEEIKKCIVQWSKYTSWLKTNTSALNLLRTIEDIDKEVDILTTEINSGLQHNTKEIKLNGYQPQILPVEIRQLIKEKRKARKKAQRTLDPEDARAATRLNNQLKEALKEHHQDQWDYKLKTIQNEKNGIWKLIKTMKSSKQPVPPLQGRNGLAFSKEEKAEILAESIEAQCSPNNHLGNHEIEQTVIQSTALLDEQPAEPIQHATYAELTNIIKKLKIRKAPGLDGISNKAVKLMPQKSTVKLLNILNACLRNCYFPEKWKSAVVITIPKPGKDHSRPENHRPISLLPTFSKILERLILTRLNEELENKKIIPLEQFGFRRGHSCELQTLRLAELISNGFEQKHTTSVAFLDIAKAFDKVWHQGLISKMCRIQLQTGLIKITQSFLKNRKFQVKMEEHLSTIRELKAGVPQGSVLGPVLYNIYTYDIPETANTFRALFADDTALGARSNNTNIAIIRLQRSLNEVTNWLNNWKIAVNQEKTQAICFNKKHRIPDRNLKQNGQPIAWANNAKYLGLTFDRKLTWKTHTDNQKKIGTIAMIQLYPLLKNEHFNLRYKLMIYLTVIRPAITYAAVSWGSAAPTHINKVQVIQNKILRIITDAPWFVSNSQLHRELKVPSIWRFLKATATKIMQKAENHENELVRQAVNYNIQDCRVHARRPRLLLTLGDGPY